MQFLSRPPGAVAAIFPQMVNHQAHVLEMLNLRGGIPEPETLRIIPNQCSGALDQFRCGRNGRCQFVQFIGKSNHADNLRRGTRQGKGLLAGSVLKASSRPGR